MKMTCVLHVIIILCARFYTSESASSASLNNELVSSQGESNYKLMVQESKLPRYGECYRNALKSLHEDCEILDDEIQSRLALIFTNCYISRFGWEVYPCKSSQPLTECMEGLDPRAATVYSAMLTNTLSMCHFIQAQVWHQDTQSAVHRLRETSDEVSLKLVDAVESAAALKVQLNDQISESRKDLKVAFDEIKENASEQRGLMVDVFDKLSLLHSLLMNEFTWIYSLVFYISGILVALLVTSSTRTSDARLGLILLLGVGLTLERSLLPWVEYLVAPEMLQVYVHWYLWVIRRCTVTVCTWYLLYKAVFYTDLALLNSAKLEELNNATREIHKLFTRNPGLEVTASTLATIQAFHNESDSDDSNYDPREDATYENHNTSNESGIIDVNEEALQSERVLPSKRIRDRQFQNPILKYESPEAFRKVIETMADASIARNMSMFHQCDDYSSDESSCTVLTNYSKPMAPTPLKLNPCNMMASNSIQSTPIKSPNQPSNSSNTSITATLNGTPTRMVTFVDEPTNCATPNKCLSTPVKMMCSTSSTPNSSRRTYVGTPYKVDNVISEMRGSLTPTQISEDEGTPSSGSQRRRSSRRKSSFVL